MASVLLSLIPAVIARLRGKAFLWWWFGSWWILIVSAVFSNDWNPFYISLIFLVILIIAAIIKIPQKPSSVLQDQQQNN
jgi:hypothetical protein